MPRRVNVVPSVSDASLAPAPKAARAVSEIVTPGAACEALSTSEAPAGSEAAPVAAPRRRGRPPRAAKAPADGPGEAPVGALVPKTAAVAPEGTSPSETNDAVEAGTADAVVEVVATETEFQRLFAQWQATGDPQTRDRLILMHRNLVSYLARRFTDRGEMYDDIIQQGLIGLINALDHFDPKRGVRFATFATPTIVGEIRRYFRDKTWGVRVPRRLQELHQAINKKIEVLTHELDRSPTYQEIARSLNVEVEQVVEAMEMTHALEPASLDEPSSGEDGGPISDQIGGNDPNLDRWGDYSQLQSALEQLSERQQTVLKLAYFEGFSQAEIARQIKVSPMHVSRLQRRALAQLRELMEEQE
ncbi:MAG: polymerase sigma-B factor [Abditibacteriota bacterium]|nr:polymerase sigma-B factor [Abditibacteriota bacterium]